MGWARLLLAVCLGVALPACSGQQETGRTVVASIYPLAWAAERVADPGWEVVDLTPPGVEAHDVELSLEDRAAIEEADVVVYMGDIGFQPQVEAAVDDASGRVVTAWVPGLHHPPPADPDPHAWLDPVIFAEMAGSIGRALREMERTAALRADAEALDRRFREGLARCRDRTMIVSHEAFAYLGGRYDIRQFGLAGVTPEGEPTAGRLTEARRLIEVGEAGAVFYEAGGESQRAIDNLAADAGVPALPLSTLESEPPSGDYISVMEDNLESLRKGLGCR
jgi:zinc transport system substrate-binding protein